MLGVRQYCRAMTQDNPFLGIVLMLGFCIVAPMGDAMAKLLGGQVPIGQLLFLRFLIQVILLVPLMHLMNLTWRMTPRVFKYTLLRTLLHIAGIGMMFSALMYLPLADAIAIAFVLPFIMLLLGAWFLGEQVGKRRLWACLVGFLGTLLVVQPAFESVGFAALLPIGVAVNFAFFMLVTRKIAKDIDPVSLQAISGVIAVALLGPLVIFVPAQLSTSLSWVWPASDIWMQLILLGVFGTLGHLLMTFSLRFAPSATVAPMQYLEIPFATMIGWLIFADLPNAMATLGICITIAAGLYIMVRERQASQALKAELASKPQLASQAE